MACPTDLCQNSRIMPRLLSADNFYRLRQYFADCNYTRDGIRQVLHSNDVGSQRLGNLPLLLHRTRESSQLNALIRLFTLGAPISASAAMETIPDWVLMLCVRADLLEEGAGTFTPKVAIMPFLQFLVAADRSIEIEKADRSDLVLGVNPTTWLL